jgi:hypothetical protein
LLLLYLTALLVTVCLEVPVVALVFEGQRARMALVCLVATTATHLAMHFVLPPFAGTVDVWVITGELGALILEAGAYWWLSQPRSLARAMIASSIANSLSFVAGLLLSS